jgi:hypothetical protein
MASEMIREGSNYHKLSKKALIKDITIVSRQVGPRAAEFVQRLNQKQTHIHIQAAEQ